MKTRERGEVVVDEHLQTRNPLVWAAGDVTGHPQFMYVAAAHGTLAADNAPGWADAGLHRPAAGHSPAIASVGMTAARAIAVGLSCDCRTSRWNTCPAPWSTATPVA